MDGKGLENFLRSASAGLNQGPSLGEGLMQMLGGSGMLPPGFDAKQMEQMWKYLDNMAESNPDEYKKLIDEQMKEMKQEVDKEKEAEKKAQTIQSEPAFCIKFLVAKKIEEKDKKSKKQKEESGIKMFDFHSSQIKESFADNQEKNDPLEEPKIYLNVVFHEKVLTPLNKNRDLADPKNDREWMIIPMIFTEGKKRKNIEGIECITYDVHINNCVVQKMKEETRAMKSISNFIILKFQEYLEDEFVLHKKSIKFIKKRRYKCPKGTESQKVQPFVLPKEHDLKTFQSVKERVLKEQEERKKKEGLAPKKEDIKLIPTQGAAATTSDKKEEANLSDIRIPGQPSGIKSDQPAKKAPVIMEMSKTIPNHEYQDLGAIIQMTFNVEEEESARDIEIDASETELKLNSKNYEFKYNFKVKNGFEVDPNSVKAKFNKSKRTLTLTLSKK